MREQKSDARSNRDERPRTSARNEIQGDVKKSVQGADPRIPTVPANIDSTGRNRVARKWDASRGDEVACEFGLAGNRVSGGDSAENTSDDQHPDQHPDADQWELDLGV